MREIIEDYGFVCTQASDGEIAYEYLKRDEFDCIILDRMMPNLDGMGLTRLLKSRGNTTPIIFLTALGKTLDKIEWLVLGVDDYLVKPFDLEELRLRVINITSRGKRVQWGDPSQKASSSGGSNLIYGPIQIDRKLAKVKVSDRIISLSPKEYEILVYFVEHPEVIISRDQLYEEVWGDDSSTLNNLDTVNVHIAHLRKKLGINCISTIKHQGYALELS